MKSELVILHMNLEKKSDVLYDTARTILQKKCCKRTLVDHFTSRKYSMHNSFTSLTSTLSWCTSLQNTTATVNSLSATAFFFEVTFCKWRFAHLWQGNELNTWSWSSNMFIIHHKFSLIFQTPINSRRSQRQNQQWSNNNANKCGDYENKITTRKMVEKV